MKWKCENCGLFHDDCKTVSTRIEDMQKEISLLKKEKAVLLEAVDDIVTDNLYENEIHNILNAALEKLKEIRE